MERSASDWLGASGPLSAALPGYEERPGQLAMAEAVERALADDRVLLCEAGTGTGKTLAYLVPAILSGKRVVVSTATRALQDQIFFRDLPMIEHALGLRTRAALMKGLSNYVCRRRYREFGRSAEASRPEHHALLDALRDWQATSEAGDIAELAAFGDDHPIWNDVTASTDTRVGPRCEFHGTCFVTRMKREAEAAHIIVVNHHLFFADLVLRGPHPGRVLPDYDAVVFDEAHRIEDIATTFFSLHVSTTRVSRLLREAERSFAVAGLGDTLLARRGAGPLLTTAESTARGLFEALSLRVPPRTERVTVDRDAWVGPVEAAWHAFDTALEALGGFADAAADSPDLGTGPIEAREALAQVARRADSVRDDLASVVEGAPGRITWFEQGARSQTLRSTPVDVSHALTQRVFDSIPSVILTSATLSDIRRSDAARPFGFVRRRLGIDDRVDPLELVVSSPFAFEDNALLYVPAELPEPNSPGYHDAAVKEIERLIQLSDGGAFVLTTSTRSLRSLHAALRGRVGDRPLLAQGDVPKATLVGRFRTLDRAVLVATMGFWEGVDVPGNALRLVILDKIPFPVPTDPIVKARSEAIDAEGGRAFMDLHVPQATLALKQGFGRLIRTSTDRGVVALLDPRVHTKGYGRRLLAGLPPARVVSDFAEVERFWSTRPDARS